MRRPRGLSRRLLVAIALLATLLIAVFTVLLVALHGEQTADREANADARIAVAASNARMSLARVVVAERGLAIVGARPDFVASWRHDAASLRAQVGVLERLTQAGAPQSTHAIAARARAYLDGVSIPLVTLAKRSPARARGRIARGRDRSADALDDQLAALGAHEFAARRARHTRAAQLVQLASIAGVTGIVATLVCALGFLGYVRRAILTPLRGVAGAARSLASGNLDARVPEQHHGLGEVGELARTFDQMAVSLQESRMALERQNEELASQSVELVEAVRSAREGASVLRAVLDATPDAIALLHRDGAVLVDNPPMRAVREAFGAQATAIDRRGSLVALHDVAGGRDGRSADGSERRDEVTLLGTRRTFARYVAPVHDGRGRMIGRLLVLREVTGEREAERAKDEFFALVSHELRTPLTAILGYVELLLGEDDTGHGEHGRHLEVIERNARRLLRLVGDLLFAAQVEAGSLLLEPGAVDLPQLVREAITPAQPLARQRGIELRAEVEPLPHCRGDRDRLAQVLDNLVSNALKFTPPGGRVTVRLASERDAALLAVQDSGLGIPQGEIPRLFDRFYRATNATARAVPGAGLGLTIVRAIVEGHRGVVHVASELGRGTTVTIRLPLEPAPTPEKAEPSSLPRYAAGGR
jgi:signal transduction histidine kinase/HAMP domain-containing protein